MWVRNVKFIEQRLGRQTLVITEAGAWKVEMSRIQTLILSLVMNIHDDDDDNLEIIR
jgi:hypothetical protein